MIRQRCGQTFEHRTLARRALAVRPTLAVVTNPVAAQRAGPQVLGLRIQPGTACQAVSCRWEGKPSTIWFPSSSASTAARPTDRHLLCRSVTFSTLPQKPHHLVPSVARDHNRRPRDATDATGATVGAHPPTGHGNSLRRHPHAPVTPTDPPSGSATSLDRRVDRSDQRHQQLSDRARPGVQPTQFVSLICEVPRRRRPRRT